MGVVVPPFVPEVWGALCLEGQSALLPLSHIEGLPSHGQSQTCTRDMWHSLDENQSTILEKQIRMIRVSNSGTRLDLCPSLHKSFYHKHFKPLSIRHCTYCKLLHTIEKLML